MLKGNGYRFLSSDIDTRSELLAFLQKVLTPIASEQFIKDKGIILCKGKMAIIEGDDPSLLQWNKAATKFIKTSKTLRYYRVTVPIEGSSGKQMFMVEYQFIDKKGWRISRPPYLVK